MNQTPVKNTAAFEKATRYITRAIVCLCVTMLFFGVGVFLISPESVVGLVSLCLGVVIALYGIGCFVLYARYLKEAEQER